jgi:hypothetical protein
MRMVLKGVLTAAVWAVALSASVDRVQAQDYRGWTTSSVQMVELRPLGLDTVSSADVEATSDGRFLYDGLEVTCAPGGTCTGYLPLDVDRTVAATQDVGLTYWGLGVEGLSVTALGRVRLHVGSDIVWPRSDDEFDAILAYAQLNRGAVRVRAGRQDVRSGLGLSAFDGLSASYSFGSARGEVYGGRSLARGLREPANEALQGLDDFFLDHSVLLLGASASVRSFGIVATARYHREILWDRSSLVSERAAFDFSTVLTRVRIRGSVDYDFSFQQVGKAELTASAPLADGRWLVEVSGRRYVPYFDLSTIWGFFEPVSYSELIGRVSWSATSSLGVSVSGGARSYGNTETTVILEPMRDNGWRADAGARWQPTERWSINGRYELEWGPGGFLNSGDATARYQVNDRLGASVSALTFQQIEEYRLGEGRAFGGGASVDYDWNDRITAMAGFSMIKHRDGGNVFTSPWNQARAWTSLRFELGGDPGLANRGGAR